jgi:hypothetical protein
VQVNVRHSVSLNCLSNCSEQEVNVVAHRCIPSLADQNIYSNHHLCQQQTALLILSFRPPRLGTVLLANLLIADKGRRWCRLTISPSCGASFLLHHLPLYLVPRCRHAFLPFLLRPRKLARARLSFIASIDTSLICLYHAASTNTPLLTRPAS